MGIASKRERESESEGKIIYDGPFMYADKCLFLCSANDVTPSEAQQGIVCLRKGICRSVLCKPNWH